MNPKSFMVIAGEASGDALAAELVEALRQQWGMRPVPATADCQPLETSLEPRFFGAGGPRMAAAGVDLAFDLTQHSVIGLSDVVRQYLTLRRLFHQLYRFAIDRQPDAIVCVDYPGFNRLFAKAIRKRVRSRREWFRNWNPKLVHFVSPQVWASREGRAYAMARDYDLLLSIFPFEKAWYARRVPEFQVEFVGHPILDRHAGQGASPARLAAPGSSPSVLLLPGSRSGELRRHLPIMIGALALIRAALPTLRGRMVLPNAALLQQAKAGGLPAFLDSRCGGLPEALAEADVAIASTGTVTMECALFGVPTVALYITSWSTYQIARRIVKVKHLAMPNILAGEPLYPEFIQDSATPQNLARATLDLLRDVDRRRAVKARLAEIVATLGGPGATHRAARAICRLLSRPGQPPHRPATR